MMMRNKLMNIRLVLSSALLVLWAGFAFAQEDSGLTSAKANRVQGPSELTEQESGFRPDLSKAPSQANPLVDRLHAARKAGDLETMRVLERQLSAKTKRTGESAGGVTLFPSTSVGGAGDLKMQSGGGSQQNPLSGPQNATGFGNDIHVRSALNSDTGEWNQSMVSDSDGNFYVAWQDGLFSNDYIQVYWSQDGGETWKGYGYVMNGGVDLKEPSLAVGQGSAGDTLLLTYIVDDGVNIPVPEVATAPLGTPNFTFHSVPVWTHWEGYAKPVIITDSFQFSGWFAYLTCEGIYDSAIDNINVCSWRSTDGGATWKDELIPFGEFDTYAWLDPDIAYGTTENRVFIVTYNDTDDTIYTTYSDDYAVSYTTEVSVYTFDTLPEPTQPVDPEIAAAVGMDNVMLCCTRTNAGFDVPGQGYSTDAGQTWSKLWPLYSHPTFDMFSVSLTANEGGNSWHLAYTGDHNVFYAHRPQDLSNLWFTSTTPVDDAKWASHDFPKKGIASNWSTDVAGIAWADYRDGYPDYDTYFDHAGEHSLYTDVYSVSESLGGKVNFQLDAGAANGKRDYILLGGITGSSPGIPLPGGSEVLPIHWDIFTNLVLSLLNTPTCKNFMAKLDASGQSSAVFDMLPVTGVAGVQMVFAFALNKPWNFASNPVQIYIVP